MKKITWKRTDRYDVDGGGSDAWFVGESTETNPFTKIDLISDNWDGSWNCRSYVSFCDFCVTVQFARPPCSESEAMDWAEERIIDAIQDLKNYFSKL